MRIGMLLLLGLLAGCQAFGDLTTDTMATTNKAVGQPPAGPAAH